MKLNPLLASLAMAALLPGAAPAAAPGPGFRAASIPAQVSPADERAAIRTYAWFEGGVYRLVGAPGHVTDIALQSGEVLLAAAAGDTARWTVGEAASGSGPGRRTHIMIKPLAAGLATNLVITTDRRVYHLELTSLARGGMAGIGWAYPGEGLVAIDHRPADPPTAPRLEAGLDPALLDFSYRIRGDHPTWRPLRAFDDGRQTFIEFPASLAQGDAPPMFITGQSGEAELVNYRVSGRFYVVDRLFERAELRLGAKRQVVVRIVRTGEGQR